MKLKKTIRIEQSAEKVWQIAADDFANAGRWMSGVVHSFAHGAAEDSATAPCDGRVCVLENTEGGLKAEESILTFDRNNYTLIFDVIPVKEKGPGLPVKKNTVTMRLERLTANSTQVHWHCDLELKFIGKLLRPLLRLALGKAFSDLLDDLKHYCETGAVSERKRKFDAKFANQPLLNH